MDLPQELLEEVVLFSSIGDIVNLMITCSKMYNITHQLWDRLNSRDFSDLMKKCNRITPDSRMDYIMFHRQKAFLKLFNGNLRLENCLPSRFSEEKERRTCIFHLYNPYQCAFSFAINIQRNIQDVVGWLRSYDDYSFGKIDDGHHYTLHPRDF